MSATMPDEYDEHPTDEDLAESAKRVGITLHRSATKHDEYDEHPTDEKLARDMKKLGIAPRSATKHDDEHPPTEEELARNERKLFGEKDLFGSNVVPLRSAMGIEGKANIIAAVSKYFCRGKIGNKFCIIDTTKLNTVAFLSRTEFVHSMESQRALVEVLLPNGEGKLKYELVSKIWLESPLAAEFTDVVLDCKLPFGLQPNKLFNLWRDFATEAHQGDCHLTLAYFKDVIANKNEEICNWVLDFLAHMVQKPWEKPEVALLLVGLFGVGKTFFMDIVNVLIDGKKRHVHCFKTSRPNDIYGNHPDRLIHLIALLLEEVTWGGDIQNAGLLKDLITGKTITINIKHGPTITVENFMRVIMGGNPGWKVPAGAGERRYTAINVSDAHQQDHAYFAAIQNELDNGGYEALMYELTTRDISKFNPRKALNTSELMEQQIASMSSLERWWLSVLRKGKITSIGAEDNGANDDCGWIIVYREGLYTAYKRAMKTIGTRQKLLQDDEFSIQWRSLIPLVDGSHVVKNEDGRRVVSLVKMKRVGKDRTYCHVIPPLSVCRELIQLRLNGNALDWEEPFDWEDTEFEND
jgi:Family of unknown function (DUF5906)